MVKQFIAISMGLIAGLMFVAALTMGGSCASNADAPPMCFLVKPKEEISMDCMIPCNSEKDGMIRRHGDLFERCTDHGFITIQKSELIGQ